MDTYEMSEQTKFVHDHRGAPEDERVQVGQCSQRPELRHPHQRRDQPERDAEDLRDDRDVDRPPEREHEGVVRMEDPLPQDVPLERREHRP